MMQTFLKEKVLILHFLDINQGESRKKVTYMDYSKVKRYFFPLKNLHHSKKRLTFADRKGIKD